MLGAAQIARSLRGALLLFRGRAEGLRLLDLTVDGFWRSFVAIVVAAPIHAADVIVGRAAGSGADEVPDAVFFSVKALIYLTDWLAFPLAIAVLARPFGFGRNYVPYIVAFNWSSVVITALFAPVSILASAGALSRNTVGLLGLVLLVITAHYRFAIARLALQVPAATALGLVILEFALSLLIVQGFGRLAGV